MDPRERPQMGDLCERVEALAAALPVDLSDRVEGLELPQLSTNSSGPGSCFNERLNENQNSNGQIIREQFFRGEALTFAWLQ